MSWNQLFTKHAREPYIKLILIKFKFVLEYFLRFSFNDDDNLLIWIIWSNIFISLELETSGQVWLVECLGLVSLAALVFVLSRIDDWGVWNLPLLMGFLQEEGWKFCHLKRFFLFFSFLMASLITLSKLHYCWSCTSWENFEFKPLKYSAMVCSSISWISHFINNCLNYLEYFSTIIDPW